MTYKKYTDQDRINALELLALGHSLSDVHRALKIPISTIENWHKDKTLGAVEVKKELDTEELAKVRKLNKEEFIKDVWENIKLSTKRLNTQLKDEEAPISARDLAIITATMYDKQALASNEATQNISGMLTIEKIVEELKGQEY